MTDLTHQVKIRLETVSSDGRYSVLAVWTDDTCRLRDGLEAIRERDETLYYQTISALDQHFPHHGPRFSRNARESIKMIEHFEIGELQLGGGPDPAIRVLWFLDEELMSKPAIVCVDAFWKDQGESSGTIHAGDRVPTAARVRKQYLQQKARGRLEWIPDEGGEW